MATPDPSARIFPPSSSLFSSTCPCPWLLPQQRCGGPTPHPRERACQGHHTRRTVEHMKSSCAQEQYIRMSTHNSMHIEKYTVRAKKTRSQPHTLTFCTSTCTDACTFILTYIHTSAHIHGHTCTHAFTHAQKQSYMNTYVHTHMHAYTQTRIHTYIHATSAYIHDTCIHAFIHSHTYKQIQNVQKKGTTTKLQNHNLAATRINTTHARRERWSLQPSSKEGTAFKRPKIFWNSSQQLETRAE